jgi:hypothetical protein
MTDEDDGMIGPLTRRSTFVLALAATLPELCDAGASALLHSINDPPVHRDGQIKSNPPYET